MIPQMAWGSKAQLTPPCHCAPLTLPWYQFSLIMNVLCWCHSSHLLRQEISISVVQCHWNRMNNGPRSWNISPRTKTEIAYMVVLACAKENLYEFPLHGEITIRRGQRHARDHQTTHTTITTIITESQNCHEIKLGKSIYLFIGPLCFPDSHSLGLNDGCVINDSLMTQGRQHPSPIIAANEKIQIEVSSSISFLISFPSSVISLSAELSRQYDEQRFGETEPWPTYGNSIVVMMTIFKRS